MTGVNLTVQIEINGHFVQAGHIKGRSFADAVFSYDDSFIASPAARAAKTAGAAPSARR